MIFPVLHKWRYECSLLSTAIAEEAKDALRETEAEVGVKEETPGDRGLVLSS
jgi:hypothetical protein